MNRRLFFLLVATALALPAWGQTRPEDAKGASRTILVTGATGRQGGAVARELLRRGYAVRGLTRNPESTRARALTSLGAEMVAGNYDDAASLRAALAGTDGIFAVTDFWEHGYEREVTHGKNLVDAALRSGTAFFVFSSVGSAHRDTGIPHFDSKREVEEYLADSGLDHAVLRPVSFIENWSVDGEEIDAGRIAAPGDPDKPNQYISVRDIGRFAADAFDDPDAWNGRSLDIAGDEISLTRICEILTDVTGHSVVPVRISWEDFEDSAGAEMTVMTRWFDEVGYSADLAALRREQPGMTTMEDYLVNEAR